MPLKLKDSEIMQCVQVKVEIGHRASPRAKPTKEGFTHDWTVYVRAPQGSNLAHFVEKVEFHLHDTFADPLRVVKEPPYHVSEVGYADFGLPIEIYFKNKGEPQKIKFNYNLFLQTHEPVNYVRCEKLTFVNPTDEFKKNLINAGGVHVLPPGKAQFADLCGPPIKTESLRKQKQPSTISSKVLALPSGEDQFAYLFGLPIKVEKQKQPSTISSKEKVSKQLLNFSGDEKPSSSGKDISASLKSSAKQVKINNKSKGHDAASTSSSSSSSISKEKVPKTHSSREKHSCKESNNSSKMVPNPSPLPSQTRPSDSPIPIENNQTKARRSSSAPSEKFRNEDNQRYEGKAIKDQVVKHNSSENKDVSQSKSKDGKDSHKTDTSKQTSSISSKKIKKESKLKDDKVSKFDDKKEAKGDKVEDNDKKELQDDKKELTKDVKDDTNEVKDHSKVKYEKQEVKDDKKEVQNRNKEVKDDRKGVKEVKDYKKEVKEVKDDKKEDILMDKKNMKEVKDDKREVKAKQSSSSSESRKHDDKCKVEIQVYTDKEDKSSKCEHSSSKSTDAKKSKSHKRKRSGSPVSALDSSMAKKQRISMKHLSNVSPMELKEDLSFPIDISSESDDDFFGDITGSDLGVDLDISPNCGISKTCNQIYSRNALKQLMDELEESSADDDDDITDAVDVFSPPKSSDKNSPLVESVKESSPLSCKINSYKAISEISPTIKKPTISTDSQRMSVTKSASEKKSESSQKDTQPPANTPSTVTKSKEGESSELKSTCKIDSIYEVKSQRKTVRKYINVKTKSSSSSESSKQDEKHKVEIKVNTDKEEKSSKCEHSSSKSLCRGENDKKEKSSNRHRKSEITTDAKKSKSHKRKRSSSLVSAVDSSVAKKQRISTKHLSNVSPMELKKDLSFPIDISSESDDDFFGDITGSDLGVDLDISPACGINKTSNQIYSRSVLKQLMDDLEDNSADDDDNIIVTVDVFSQPKSSAKNSPLIEPGKASPALSCKSNSDKLYEAISEISPTITKHTTPKDSQERSSTKRVSEKKSLNISDTRNKTQNSTPPATKAPSRVTKSKTDGENDKKDKSSNKNMKSEITTDAIKEQINRSGSSVSALDRSVANEQRNNIKDFSDVTLMELKEDLYISSDSSSESDDDFFGDITGSDLGNNTEDLSQVTLMELKDDLYISSDSSSESDDDFFLELSGRESDMDLDISQTWNISKTSNQIYSKSALKMLMHELEDSFADDEYDRKSEITTDAKKSESEQRKRAGSPLSTLFGSMAKKQRVSMKHLSNDSLMELKEDLSRSR